ncbi:hypothetical protein [Lacibacter luteus]|uniref:hypothetical protein n=1 Tax=Lacibacter luteus TaxID=2508719 RepID=UPI0013E92B14|nr:hypothetical protein [Lacibacter luteus]
MKAVCKRAAFLFAQNDSLYKYHTSYNYYNYSHIYAIVQAFAPAIFELLLTI